MFSHSLIPERVRNEGVTDVRCYTPGSKVECCVVKTECQAFESGQDTAWDQDTLRPKGPPATLGVVGTVLHAVRRKARSRPGPPIDTVQVGAQGRRPLGEAPSRRDEGPTPTVILSPVLSTPSRVVPFGPTVDDDWF